MMRRAWVLLVLLAACGGPRLHEHVTTLAGEQFEGRGTGTEAGKAAAEYIAEQFRDLDLEPVIQEFDTKQGKGQNVIAVLPGALEECVVVGAHHDHLGRKGSWIHFGADDNASGVAAVLELARRFSEKRARRTIVFAAFGGEEIGLIGSQHYVKNPVVPLEKTVAMVNLDMVGRLREQLVIFGTESGDGFKGHLSDVALKIAYGKDAVGPSDHTHFYLGGVPSVHLFTNLHEDYHKPTDTADKINYEGLAEVVGVAETLVRRVADAPRRMKYRKVDMGAPVDPHSAPVPGPEGRPYFGSIPDYAYDGKGVKLSGVTPGTPAASAGLLAGDVIVSINGKAIEDMNGYTKELFSKKPGDEITLEYDRAGQRSTAKAVLAARKKATEE